MAQIANDELLNWVEELIQAKNELEATLAYEKSKRWFNRRWLVHPYNSNRQLKQDFFHTTFQQLKQYPEKFKQLTRMKPNAFAVLLALVQSKINPLHCTKNSILAEQRLTITLMYLAHGMSIALLALTNRIGVSTVHKIIYQTCSGIYEALSPLYLKFPEKPVWRNIAKKFGELWQLPGCLSAIDGKHIYIKAPDNSGTLFYNFKKRFSIVLMAAVNHNYVFTWIDIGAFGSASDGGIILRSIFGQDLERGTLNTPEELITLPNSNIRVPYFFIGDDAFGLKNNFMKPYKGDDLTERQKVFNYRLSRARRCVESAFGILVMRWRLLEKTIGFQPHNVDSIIKACVCLHNFLSSIDDTDEDIEKYKQAHKEKRSDEPFPDNVLNIDEPTAADVRESLTEYFMSAVGQVPWQLERVRRGLNINN